MEGSCPDTASDSAKWRARKRRLVMRWRHSPATADALQGVEVLLEVVRQVSGQGESRAISWRARRRREQLGSQALCPRSLNPGDDTRSGELAFLRLRTFECWASHMSRRVRSS